MARQLQPAHLGIARQERNGFRDLSPGRASALRELRQRKNIPVGIFACACRVSALRIAYNSTETAGARLTSFRGAWKRNDIALRDGLVKRGRRM